MRQHSKRNRVASLRNRILRFGAGAVASFSPSDLPGLLLWLDTARGTFQASGGAAAGTSGDVVGEWQDQSGGGRHLTQTTTAKKPTFVTGVLNGLPVVRFDGADDVMSAAIPANASKTIILLARKIGAVVTTNGRFWQADNEANLFRKADGTFGLFGNNGGANVDLGGDTSQTSIVSIVYSNTGAAEAIINGASTAFDPWNGYATATALYVGAANSDGAVAENIEVGEFLIYDRALSSTDLGRVHAYLAERWGVTLP